MTVQAIWRKINAPRDHRWAASRFSAYVEGELSPQQDSRLRAHEGICPECRRAIRTLKSLLRALRQLGGGVSVPAVGDQTARAVLDRIQGEPPVAEG